MVSLWPYVSTLGALQAHCSKGSQSLFHLHSSQHRPPPPTSAGESLLRLNFVRIPLLPNDKLPEDCEATTDVPLHLVPYLKIAMDGMRVPVTEFLESSKPDWILQDFAPYWLPPISRRLKCKTRFFGVITAATLGTLKPPGFDDYRTSPEDFLTTPKWVPFKTPIAFKLYKCRDLFKGIMAETTEGNIPDVDRFAGVMDGCDVIVVRSSYEYEAEWLELLQDLHGKPVIPVGVLPPKLEEEYEDTDTWLAIKTWLDSRKTKSVVHVAFGSEVKLSQTELNEIALCLELSGLPFFWVLKTRRGPWDTEPVENNRGEEDWVHDPSGRDRSPRVAVLKCVRTLGQNVGGVAFFRNFCFACCACVANVVGESFSYQLKVKLSLRGLCRDGNPSEKVL
ncbi:unnamed protein product [Microthlaspi erraticum]|uniref:Uncharacterized protein n=1 Tax=Microthlaspi erraticum TaxID=1685480 RepID=A0A6D2HVM7_9BRAS|nr:unnamed protein product [Microthlaspi erraticum]